MKLHPIAALSLLLVASLAAPLRGDDKKPSPPPAVGKHRTPPKKLAAKKDDKKEEKKPHADEKPFAEIVKDMEVIKGAFTFYRKAEENKVYLEILPAQFDQTLLFAGSIAQSIGERGFYSSQMGGQFPFQFKLVGKNVQWQVINTAFTAQPGTPSAKATSRSFGHSMLGSAKILSQPHPERKSFLINLSDLLLADIPGLAPALSEAYRPTGYRFDKGTSWLGAAKSFEENALIEVWLHFVSDSPKTRSLTIPDERSIQISVKYDLSQLKETGYKPRLADDRVGHFLSLQQDFTSDRPSSPFTRRIHRWRLEKKDPAAALSEPKQPIVFWLENTIPHEYREWMKEGALLYNKAFERIGFTNAIVVKQQPDDADWDAADTRYNVIRWFAGIDASYAIGPSRANPYTGEIYDADIGFSEGIIRSVRRNGEEFVAPILPVGDESPRQPHLAWDQDGAHLCNYADGLAQQAAFGANVLAARGEFTPEMEDRMMKEFLVQVTAHEVGHTLGLRHNFRASTLLKAGDLQNTDLTSQLGQSGSVMDYNPLVIAAKGEKQGSFAPTTLGPYDYWVIEYAYKQIEGDEAAELRKIASRAAEPQLAYATDEDAIGTFSPNAVDPLVNQFDQSSDPIEYFTKRVGIIQELWSSIESKLVKEGEGYQILRRAVQRGFNEYNRALLTVSKFIGGLYHYRDHAGDKDGRPPFSPVPAEKQREALKFLEQHAFSDSSFQVSPALYNKLAPERLPGLDGIGGLFETPRVDTAWHDSVLNLHRQLIHRLHSTPVLARLQDNELRFPEGSPRFGLADLFAGMEASIWPELNNGNLLITSVRRNAQREHLKTLCRISLRQYVVPEDATSLARATLLRIDGKLEAKLKQAVDADPVTRAYWEESRARIKAALEAQVGKGIE